MKRVVIVGGGGDMGAVIARCLLARRGDVHVVLADRDVGRARRRAAVLTPARVEVRSVDVFDPSGLRVLVRSADLAVNATGPYLLTGVPVMEACLDERVDYLDLGDDLEAADRQLAFDRAARAAGVTALIGAGIAPGVLNVVVRALAERLDTVQRVRVAWVTGATPARPGHERAGRAVLEHMLHSCVGVTATVRGGRRRLVPSFRSGEWLEFPHPLGLVRVFDLGHAEIATIPRAFPGVEEVRSQGGLMPPVLNGVFQGIAAAVALGRLTWDDAVSALVDIDRGRWPGGRAVHEAIRGVAAQLFRRELRLAEVGALVAEARGSRAPVAAGIRVDVAGVVDGGPITLSCATAMSSAVDGGGMDEATGTPAAAFADLMLDRRVTGPGVVSPELAVAPHDLRAALPPGVSTLTDLLAGEPLVTSG